ncbi:MAG: hypothetical protein WBG71_15395 [Leeuwenhoekiella sp.]
MTEIIPIIKWTTTELMKLLSAKIEDKKDRFEKIQEPLMESITEIHLDYRNMFDKTLQLLPNHEITNGVENIYTYKSIKKIGSVENLEIDYGLIKTEFNSEIYLNNIKIVREILNLDRKRNDILRFKTREESKQILELSKDDYEKRFLWSVINYFFQHTQPFTSKENEDKIIESTIKNGFNHSIPTPSLLVSIDFETSNAKEIRDRIKDTSLKMSRHFEHLTSRYYELKNRTY